MTAEYEGWTVWCDYIEAINLASLPSARRCPAVIRFDEPWLTESQFYDLLDRAGWTDPEDGLGNFNYCPAHSYEN